MSRLIIFTDLDGTLLDHENYSFAPAMEALKLIEGEKIPLVICSSKTRAEIEVYREKLGNSHPFIAENGGGIFIPMGYFGPGKPEWETGGDYHLIRLGASYQDLRGALTSLRSGGWAVRGFGEMTEEQISRLTGLSLNEAALAKMREFDEPFVLDSGSAAGLPEAIAAMGFAHTMGRLNHILGAGSGKGRAVAILTELFRDKLGEITTIGAGDSPNDASMLGAVDIPFLVRQPGGDWKPMGEIPNLRLALGAGPAGWNRMILEIIRAGS